jgi:ppGpp synthetase/RelA/SpoT-type nucleotidyltranferase
MQKFLQAVRLVFHPEEEGSEDEYVRRILAEYRNKRALYEDFCVGVYNILDTFLKDQGYKYQIVYRTKSPERLREKLIRKSSQGKRYATLGDIEDLAGLRIMFYSEREKERFLKDIKNEIDGSIRVEEKQKESGYVATHLVLSFGSKRLALIEYQKFAQLKSEVQVTSILHHAWAEIEHDFIYKDVNGLKEKNPEKFAIMERKLTEILEKYIKQASREFEELMK